MWLTEVGGTTVVRVGEVVGVSEAAPVPAEDPQPPAVRILLRCGKEESVAWVDASATAAAAAAAAPQSPRAGSPRRAKAGAASPGLRTQPPPSPHRTTLVGTKLENLVAGTRVGYVVRPRAGGGPLALTRSAAWLVQLPNSTPHPTLAVVAVHLGVGVPPRCTHQLTSVAEHCIAAGGEAVRLGHLSGHHVAVVAAAAAVASGRIAAGARRVEAALPLPAAPEPVVLAAVPPPLAVKGKLDAWVRPGFSAASVTSAAVGGAGRVEVVGVARAGCPELLAEAGGLASAVAAVAAAAAAVPGVVPQFADPLATEDMWFLTRGGLRTRRDVECAGEGPPLGSPSGTAAGDGGSVAKAGFV